MVPHAGPKQLRQLIEAVLSVTADLDLAAVMTNVVEAACDLTDAKYGALGVLDAAHTHLEQFITVGLSDEEQTAIGELPKGHGILGLLIVDPKPIRLPDLSEHPDSAGFPPGHPQMQSFLGVPLFIRGEVFGNLYLTDKLNDDVFSDIDEELVIGLASAAALAIQNSQLHAQTAELSRLADRERIGRELHDAVIQRLFATGLSMQGTIQLTQHPELVARLNQHVDDIDDTIREVRRAIFELEVARSSGPSVRRDVLDLLTQSARVLGFEPRLYLDGAIDTVVPPPVAAHLLAVLREALSNVARHSGATHVEVTVQADTSLTVEIIDNGKGVDMEITGGGQGLRNMAKRADQLGGKSLIAPGAEGGTIVSWTVPLIGPGISH